MFLQLLALSNVKIKAKYVAISNMTLCQCYYYRNNKGGRTDENKHIQLLIQILLEIN